MASRPAASQAALIPLFLGQRGCNITFVVSNSENMKAILGSVKRLLIQTLLTKASLRDSLFNVMTFSSKVNLWSTHMLPCAPDTVHTSLTWIHSISCRPGRDLLAALSMALTDPACQAVHLLCTELPEQPEAVLRALPALAAGRPVNIFYLQHSGTRLNKHARAYLQYLAEATRGSCSLVPFDMNGGLNKVIPLHVGGIPSSLPTVSPVKCSCASTSVIAPHQERTHPFSVRCSLADSFSPVGSSLQSDETLDGPEFFPGCRVLARRQADGLYHPGTVIQQVQGRGGVWIVEFDHPGRAGLGVASFQRQLTCSLDMVNNRRALSHHLVPGDAVLSPWEPDLRRYGPGRVAAATERRDGVTANAVTSLRVVMWNSCVSLVSDDLVLPISSDRYDRIAREIQIPATLSHQPCGWLSSRSYSCFPKLLCTDCCPVSSSSCCCSIRNHQTGVIPPSCGSSPGTMEGSDRSEHNEQMDFGDEEVTESDLEIPTSPSLSLSEDGAGGSGSPQVKPRSKQPRPPWRYWRRTGPEPQHRQPGRAVSRRTPQPGRFMFPVPQTSASPNHSSLFQSLMGTKGRAASVYFKPRPPAGLRSVSGNRATMVHT
ncbi:uncharacterized protein C11orf16 homolog [Salarias fasciatus]|uniref:uncharacterized protein C11orf16 homolog n=1 Tax=Salarias fasciatus TaxID=181472 RepID=UPI0011766CA8|nr:uncharacterized protein C11orf16 homolog [Salarias fasciatus]